MNSELSLCLTSSSADATGRIAQALGRHLAAGDTVLLSGPVGAGKSHFARSLIQSRLHFLGRHEDVPSPTFTIVQSYDLGEVELWHADLYRLTGPSECDELGLLDAFETAICLVEWPEKLGALVPQGALHVNISPDEDMRQLRFTSENPNWGAHLAGIAQE